MVLLNLIVNARDSMVSGGPILISASHEMVADGEIARLPAGGYVKVAVKDSGSGMDAETLRRAAEPFFTTKGVGKGTGLGLPMVHGMAQQIGGIFELLSEVGDGTRAVLWLPIAEDMPVAAAEPAVEAVPRHMVRLNILAVDDDALVLINTAALLEDLGHEVVEAESEAEALKAFQEHDDIDLVVTDQAMPTMTGVDLIAAIDVIRPGMPVIIASGYGEGVETPGRETACLSKPFNQARLAEAIAQAIERG